MSKIDNGGPAFPVPLNQGQIWNEVGPCDGMTLRQYAAIKLRVPDSGTDWLDEMIRKSARDEFAAKALAAVITGAMADGSQLSEGVDVIFSRVAYMMADAMLHAREANQ